MEKKPQIPEELKKKFDDIKQKLEKFKQDALKKFPKDITGIALLPVKNVEAEKDRVLKEEGRILSKEEEEKIKTSINVFVLLNDKDQKNILEFKNKISKEIWTVAKKIDKNLFIDVLTIEELKENLYDGKYEILRLISMSAFIYDPVEFLAALKVSEIHKTMVLKKFEKYIVSYIAAGSFFRGDKKSHDIDVYVVVDDTDVKRMGRYELKDKLRAIIIGQGFEASKIAKTEKQFHIQTYILTDFWDAVKDAHPVIYTFLRDGVPLYDRGVFMPWKLLLKMGRIRPSPEAIEMQMDLGEKLISRTRHKMLSIVGEDLFYAIMNPAQAALMLYGIAPPTPKETIRLLREIFVKKEKMLEEKYVKILEDMYKYFKDIEHGKTKEISGKDIDKLLDNAKDYLSKIKKIFEELNKKRDKLNVDELQKSCKDICKDVFEVYGSKGVDFDKNFKALIKKKEIPAKYYEIFKDVMNIKKKKLSKAEHDKLGREARIFIKTMVEFIQRKRGLELERTKVRVKYGDKYGEIFLLDNEAFIIEDMDAKDKEINKATILDDGGLGSIRKSSLEELEKKIKNIKIPERVFVKNKLFGDLKEIFGDHVEILVSY
ncbi:MAG: hypothetical protein KJ674_02535 [Nanoarchaeota archaeon]|nr:hypothetical protein [Nanoarchaeota archaeon]